MNDHPRPCPECGNSFPIAMICSRNPGNRSQLDPQLEDRIKSALSTELRARLMTLNHEPNECCLHTSIDECVAVSMLLIEQLHGPDRDRLIRRLVVEIEAKSAAPPKATGTGEPGRGSGPGGGR